MKLLTLIFFSFFCFSCSQTKQNSKFNEVKTVNNKYEKFGNELIESDYLKFANPNKIDSLNSEIKNSFSIYDEETYKFAQIDAEELAEFNFDFFLPQLNQILEKRNVSLNVKTTNDYQKTNDITINDEKINLYTKTEVENQVFWDSAPRNFFRKINEILKSKNVNERFYLLYGGNDLSTLLLTEKQFDIIKEYYKNDKNEIPYLP